MRLQQTVWVKSFPGKKYQHQDKNSLRDGKKEVIKEMSVWCVLMSIHYVFLNGRDQILWEICRPVHCATACVWLRESMCEEKRFLNL